MIVVRVELHSAITRQVTEIARMDLCNISGARPRGDYLCQTFRGRSREALAERSTQRQGFVHDHPRLSQHVWYLVAKALKALNYDN